MGKRSEQLSSSQIEFIQTQHMFFVATAAPEGRINLSPKGMDTLRVINPTEITWLNLTGSGNETAAHIESTPRMTMMWCAFEGRPLILRAYGEAKLIDASHPRWSTFMETFPSLPGARQIITLKIDLVQSSCGMGVPFYDYQGERDGLIKWANQKGEVGVKEYRDQKNRLSLDGKSIHSY